MRTRARRRSALRRLISGVRITASTQTATAASSTPNASFTRRITRGTNGNSTLYRMPRRPDPDRLNELEELFADLWQVPRFAPAMRRAHRPQLDVFRTEDPAELVIVVEIPGADPERLRIELDGARLRISGERPRPRAQGSVWYRSEIEYGPFERELSVAVDVAVEDAAATYERGLLRIVLPIAQRPPPPARVPIKVRRAG